MQPLVSILVRSMGRPTLARALDSAAAQTWSNLEIIVVAACGRAHRELPSEWKGRRLRLIFPDPDRTLARPGAANAALDAAQGEWLNLLDDDDELLPSHVAALLASPRPADARVIYSRSYLLDERGAVDQINNASGYHLEFLYRNRTTSSATLFHRSLVAEGARFDPAFAVYEDYDFWINCAARSAFHFVDLPTTKWHAYIGESGSGQGANTDAGQHREYMARLQCKWSALFNRWLSDPEAVVAAARHYLKTADDEIARNCLHHMERLHPQDARTASLRKAITTPLVSILIRSMDRPTLARALDSAAAQDWPNIEIVVVAACGSAHRALPSVWKGRPLRLIYPQPDRLLLRPDAANLCLDSADGVWLNFLDDDDELLPNHLSTLLAAPRTGGERVVFSRTRVIDAQGRTLGHISHAGNHVQLYFHSRATTCALLFHRSLIDEGVRFDADFTVHEDHDFQVNCAARSEFAYVDEATCVWHAQAGDSGCGFGTNDDGAKRSESVRRIRHKWNSALRHWLGDADAVQFAGEQYRLNGDAASARACFEQVRHLRQDNAMPTRALAATPALRESPAREAMRSGEAPLVSILIRSMDRPTLERALDSAAAQTWPNLEIVVVAACGSGHRALPETWNGRPLRLIHPDPDRRLPRPDAANACLDAARGEWLNFLDDDDELLPEHVATLMAAPRQPATRVVYSRARVIDAQGKPLGRVGFASVPVQLYYQNRSHPAATLFHRSLVAEGARFDPDFPVYEDHDFFINCATRSDFQFVDATTCIWNAFIGDSGVGHGDNTDEAQRAHFHAKLHRKWAAFFQPLLGQPEALLFVGQQYLRENDPQRALDYLEGALRARPDDVNALNLAGMANLRSGNFDRAEALLTRALHRLPDHAGLKENLALLRRTRDAATQKQ